MFETKILSPARRPLWLAGAAAALLLSGSGCKKEVTPSGEVETEVSLGGEEGAVGEAIAPAAVEEAGDPPEVMLARWRVDTDGDAIPDYVETRLVGPEGNKSCLVSVCQETQELGMNDLPRQVNTLVLLDASNSMATTLKDTKKNRNMYQVATRTVERFVEAVPRDELFQVGLLAFGHKGGTEDAQKQESCQAAELLQPLGTKEPKAFQQAMAKVGPTGYSPLALALQRGAEALPEGLYVENRLILISDGIETCDDDPLAQAKELSESGRIDRIDVVGFNLEEQTDIDTLTKIAETTGGTFYQAPGAEEFYQAFGTLAEQAWKTQDAVLCGVRNAEKLKGCYTDLITRAGTSVDETIATYEKQEGAEELVGEMRRTRQELERGGRELGTWFDEWGGRLTEVETYRGDVEREWKIFD